MRVSDLRMFDVVVAAGCDSPAGPEWRGARSGPQDTTSSERGRSPRPSGRFGPDHAGGSSIPSVAATILIVEDEYAVARGIQYAFQQEGYDVGVARSGEEGL